MTAPVDGEVYVRRALELVRDALAPFIMSQIKLLRPAAWQTDLVNLFGARTTPIDASDPPWDPYYTMKGFTDQSYWDLIFKRFLGSEERQYIFELSRMRNRAAHATLGAPPITVEEAHRALDNTVLLLNAIKATQAAEAMAIRADVRKILFADGVTKAPPGPVLISHRILNSHEPEFAKFLDLLTKAVPDPRLRDSDGDLARWLEQSSIYMAQPIKVDGIYLVAKHKESDAVVGLLFASDFPTLSFLFLNYIAYDRELASEARSRGDLGLSDEITYNSSRMLLDELAERVKKGKGIVAEVPRDTEIAELNRLFSAYGRHVFDSKPYIFDIEYIQPALDPLKLHDTPRLDLLYMPGPEHQRIIDDNGGCLPRDEATEVLRFVYSYGYGGNFKTRPEGTAYRAHVAEILELVSQDLPPLIPLKALAPW